MACSTEGCDKKVRALGLCGHHYNVNRYGAKALAEYKRGWRSRNSEQIHRTRAAWRATHQEQEREARRAWVACNREKANAYANEWKRHNRDKARAQFQRYKARKLAAPINDFTAADWQELLVEHDHRCFYCGITDVPLQQEHMIPLSRGGAHTKDNIVPACGPCNSRKHTKTAVEYLRFADDRDAVLTEIRESNLA